MCVCTGAASLCRCRNWMMLANTFNLVATCSVRWKYGHARFIPCSFFSFFLSFFRSYLTSQRPTTISISQVAFASDQYCIFSSLCSVISGFCESIAKYSIEIFYSFGYSVFFFYVNYSIEQSNSSMANDNSDELKVHATLLLRWLI